MREERTVDWAVLDLPDVRKVVGQAARRVHRQYEQYTELDDLTQDALVLVATKADLQEAARSEKGLLQYRLEMDLIDSIKYVVSHQHEQLSYEGLQEATEDGTYVRPYVAIETASGEYTRESVETLLPAVWDETYTYSLPQRDNAPDPDMPKGSSNKATANNLAAYIADIKTGWEKTPLTKKERISLLLAFGFGWAVKDIAFNQGVSHQAISKRIETAVGKITARLNGGYWYELRGIEV